MTLVTRTLEEIKERAQRRRRPLAPWSDEKVRKAAKSDPDSWLPSRAELEQFRPAADRIKELAEAQRAFDDDR